VLSEGACDELLLSIARLGNSDVHSKAVDTLKRLKQSATFGLMLDRGLTASRWDQKGFIEIKGSVESGGKTEFETLGADSSKSIRSTRRCQAIRFKYAALVLVLKDFMPPDTQNATVVVG
jgi:hypothetical protein